MSTLTNDIGHRWGRIHLLIPAHASHAHGLYICTQPHLVFPAQAASSLRVSPWPDRQGRIGKVGSARSDRQGGIYWRVVLGRSRHPLNLHTAIKGAATHLVFPLKYIFAKP